MRGGVSVTAVKGVVQGVRARSSALAGMNRLPPTGALLGSTVPRRTPSQGTVYGRHWAARRGALIPRQKDV
jgi:hypothetical protein